MIQVRVRRWLIPGSVIAAESLSSASGVAPAPAAHDAWPRARYVDERELAAEGMAACHDPVFEDLCPEHLCVM